MIENKRVSDFELEAVSGGAGWQKYARGSCVDYGAYVVYTVAAGDMLSAIAPRFGVTIPQIQQWNGIKDPRLLHAGQKLTIYPAAIR